MKYNYDNGQKDFWAYEIGRTYYKTDAADEKFSGVKEHRILGGVITGKVENSLWQKSAETDFYTVMETDSAEVAAAAEALLKCQSQTL